MTPPTESPHLVERIIEASARNKFLVILFTLAALAAAVWAVQRTPLDAVPDLSDTQVIVYTDWEGRSPDLIEDQITYPISARFIAAPHVKFVRGESMFGKSFVYVIFEDGTDMYWARSRVIEYLKTPPDRATILAMVAAAGLTLRAALRQKGTPYAELGLDNPALTDDQLLDAIAAHPILLNRPFVVTPHGTRLCRPSEVVREVLG